MAVVRDPAFWRRFSMAVHLDEEATKGSPELKHSDSWLARQNSKRSRRTCICWAFWLSFIAIAAGVVIVVLWLNASGVLNHAGKSAAASATTTTSATATSTATHSSTKAATATATLAARMS